MFSSYQLGGSISWQVTKENAKSRLIEEKMKGM
jgi:hypothetical protein